MGRRIDRSALWALIAAGYYLFYLNAWHSVMPACLAAFVSCALTRRLFDHLPRRVSMAEARSALQRVAAMPDDEAAQRLSALVRGRWPGEDFRLVPALKHPEATLSSGDILSVWKANRDAGRLVIAATCIAEPRAAFYARQLQKPAVAVLDSRALTRLMRAPGAPTLVDPVPPVSPLSRLREGLTRVRLAPARPRNALLAAAMLALYLARGNPLSLFGALALLGQLGEALIGRRTPKRLFE